MEKWKNLLRLESRSERDSALPLAPAPLASIPLIGECAHSACTARHGKLSYGLQECPPQTFPQRASEKRNPNSERSLVVLICWMGKYMPLLRNHQGCKHLFSTSCVRSSRNNLKKDSYRWETRHSPLISSLAPLRCTHQQHKPR